MELHREIRIEVMASELVAKLEVLSSDAPKTMKLNNVIIPGYKDIGPNGWITFVFREQEVQNATKNQEENRAD